MTQDETENSSPKVESESRPVIRRNGSFLKPASSLVPQLLRQIPGFDARLAQLLTQWGDIIGPPLNQFCAPDKIIQGRGKDDPCILQLRVMGAAALEIQHQQPQIIERINGYFGHRMIHGLRLVQGFVPNAPAAPKPVRRGVQNTALPENLNEIEHPELRESLIKLAQSLD